MKRLTQEDGLDDQTNRLDNLEKSSWKIFLGFIMFWIVWGIGLVYALYHFVFLGYIVPLF